MSDDRTYKLTVTYAAGHDQVHDDLSAEQVSTGANAFVSDLTSLGGRGIKRLVVEVDDA